MTCPDSRGQDMAEPNWRPGGRTHTGAPICSLLRKRGSEEEMRPAPASGFRLWAAEEGGALGQSRVQQRFPGMWGCGAVCFGSMSALSSPSLPLGPPTVGPSSAHSLPAAPRGSACSSHKPLGRQGVGSQNPFACPFPHPGVPRGLMGEHGFWVHLGLKLSSAREKLCDPGQFKLRFLHL